MIVVTLAERLLAAVLDSLEACGRPAPKHCGVVPGGEFSPSRCCEGHAWVRLLPATPVVNVPTPDPCVEFGWQLVFEAGVARCPAPQPQGALGQLHFPAPAELARAAAGQYGDAQALAAGVTNAVAAWRDEDPDDLGGPLGDLNASVGGMAWLNTATCLGVIVQARVQVTGWCCDELGVAPTGPQVSRPE